MSLRLRTSAIVAMLRRSSPALCALLILVLCNAVAGQTKTDACAESATIVGDAVADQGADASGFMGYSGVCDEQLQDIPCSMIGLYDRNAGSQTDCENAGGVLCCLLAAEAATEDVEGFIDNAAATAAGGGGSRKLSATNQMCVQSCVPGAIPYVEWAPL